MIVVLILFGSKGLPGIAKNLGRGMREIRTASNEIKRDLQNSAMDMRKDLKVENPIDELPKLNKIFDEETKSTVQVDSQSKQVEENKAPEGVIKTDDNPKKAEEEA